MEELVGEHEESCRGDDSVGKGSLVPQHGQRFILSIMPIRLFLFHFKEDFKFPLFSLYCLLLVGVGLAAKI